MSLFWVCISETKRVLAGIVKAAGSSDSLMSHCVHLNGFKLPGKSGGSLMNYEQRAVPLKHKRVISERSRPGPGSVVLAGAVGSVFVCSKTLQL